MIQHEDLLRDLQHWETLLVSSMMQRPVKTIVNDDQVWDLQQQNLRSAVSIGTNGLVGFGAVDQQAGR